MTENIRQLTLKLTHMCNDMKVYGRVFNKHAYNYVRVKRKLNEAELKEAQHLESLIPFKTEFNTAIQTVSSWD